MRALLALAVAALAVTAHAEEITLSDGRRLTGTLTLADNGRLLITAADKADVPVNGVRSVRFSAAAPTFRAGVVHEVHLIGEQRLTGELMSLDDKALTLRTAWRDRMAVTRGALVGVTNLPGTAIVCDEDFEKGLKAWKVSGAPRVTDDLHTSGQSSLLLDGVGQLVAYTLAAPIEAGSIGVNFHLPDSTAGARWLLEAEFQSPSGPQMVRTVLADDTNDYTVDAPPPADEKGRVKRQPGWHRFGLELGPKLLVTIDDAVLWYSRDKGSGGPLRTVRLMCVADKGAVRGAVAFDEFTIARAVEVLHRPADTSTQDEMWMMSGDQLFGRLLRLDRREVEWEGRSGKRSASWGEVRGVFPQRPALAPATTEGAQVRVWLRPARGSEPDELVGVVRALDERRLTLRHAALGDIEIDRGHLLRLRPLFHGKRIELDNGARHLGEKGRVESGGQPARAEGPEVEYRFRLERQAAGRLVLMLRPLRGLAEVAVNGRVVADLDQYVGRDVETPVRVTVPLPRDALKVGDNVVTLRVRESAGRRGSCLVSEVAVELPE